MKLKLDCSVPAQWTVFFSFHFSFFFLFWGWESGELVLLVSYYSLRCKEVFILVFYLYVYSCLVGSNGWGAYWICTPYFTYNVWCMVVCWAGDRIMCTREGCISDIGLLE